MDRAERRSSATPVTNSVGVFCRRAAEGGAAAGAVAAPTAAADRRWGSAAAAVPGVVAGKPGSRSVPARRPRRCRCGCCWRPFWTPRPPQEAAPTRTSATPRGARSEAAMVSTVAHFDPFDVQSRSLPRQEESFLTARSPSSRSSRSRSACSVAEVRVALRHRRWPTSAPAIISPSRYSPSSPGPDR